MTFTHWFFVAVIAYVFWRYSKTHASPSKKTSQPEYFAPVFTWPALGNYDFEVTGESFYQPALQSIAGQHGEQSAEIETTAIVLPDNNNPHDKNAVKVLIGGFQVGHLSREDAPRYRRRLAAKKPGASVAAECGALVMGGFIKKDGKRASYGVRLDMKPFD